ncbi:hypothetical protein ACHAPA_010253 [Fusarium lateritium]
MNNHDEHSADVSAGYKDGQSPSVQAQDSSSLIPPEILEHHRLWETGQEVSEYTDFHLVPMQFQQARSELEHHFKRFEYDPTKSILTVIMPAGPHADTVSEILLALGDIKREAARASGDQNVIDILDACHITAERDQTFEVPGVGKHDSSDRILKVPDISVKHTHASFPGIVIEVAYSQTAEALKKKALWILSQAKGGIKVVIAIKLAYRDETESFVTIFHRKNSTANSTASIHFSLSDFAWDNMSKNWPVVNMELPLLRLEKIVQKVTTYNGNHETSGPARGAPALRISPSTSGSGLSNDGDSTGDYCAEA